MKALQIGDKVRVKTRNRVVGTIEGILKQLYLVQWTVGQSNNMAWVARQNLEIAK